MPTNFLLTTNGVTQQVSDNSRPPDSVTGIITNGFFSVDNKWTVRSWNTAAEKLMRVPAKDIIGKNLWDIFSLNLPADVYKTYRKMPLVDIPAHIRQFWPQMNAWFEALTFYSKDKLYISFKSSHPTLPDSPEKQLKVLNELYRFVSEITNDCLWEWNIPAQEIFWIDGGHKKAFGYQIENALIHQSFWEDRLHPDDKVRILDGLQNIIHKSLNPVWEDEYRFRKLNNEYAFVHDRGHIIRGEGNIGIRMIGATQDITSRKLSEKQLQDERQTKQRQITSAVITAQETERAGIGRELHDNLNQILAVTKLYIEMAMTDNAKREMYLEKSLSFITNVITEVRKISRAMVAPGMDGLHLYDIVRSLIADITQINPVKIRFTIYRMNGRSLDEQLQLNIYRIIQEQLTNILRHSKATRVSISLTGNSDGIILEISDNGMGCDPSALSKGLGIRNIISRAELSHGLSEIISSEGSGFTLKVTFKNPDKLVMSA